MNKTKLYESPDVTIFLWKGGPEVGVVKADICKSVNCCKITDAPTTSLFMSMYPEEIKRRIANR